MIANAGFARFSPFSDLRDDEVEALVQVNATHVAYTIKTLSAQMLARKKKSAIIVTSSGMAAKPFAGHTAYAAAKSFASYMAEGLNFEFKGKIDVMSYQAGEVATKMLGRYVPDRRTITPERAAESCFRDLGLYPMTRGAFRHDVGNWLIDVLPIRIVNPFLFKMSKVILKKFRDREAKNKT